MTMPQDTIKIPNRFINVRDEVLERFPFFMKLIKKTIESNKNVFDDKKLIYLILMNNIVYRGLDPNTCITFLFSKDEITKKLKYQTNGPEYHFYPYSYFWKASIPYLVEQEDEDDVYYFFERLNERTKHLYNPLNKKIRTIFLKSRLVKFIDELRDIYGKIIEEEIIDHLDDFIPKIDFIDRNTFYNVPSFGGFSVDYFLQIERKIKNIIENTHIFDISNKNKLIEKLIKISANTQSKISDSLVDIPEKYIIDLAKL